MFSHARRTLRAATLVGVTAVGVTLCAVPALAGGVTGTPTVALSLPGSIGNGGSAVPGSVTVANNTGGTTSARVDFHITPNGQTGDLDPTYFDFEYCSGGTGPACTGGSFQPIVLTSDGGSGLTGFLPPSGGTTLPNGYNVTTALTLRSTTAAPEGSIHVLANLDTSPGNTGSSVSSSAQNITLAVPAISVAPSFPSSLGAGDPPTDFTLEVDNNTGSSYPAVRFDFTIDSTNDAFDSSFLTFQYCNGGTGSACTGGTWDDVALSDPDPGVIMASSVPDTGFALPNSGSNSILFRVGVDQHAPATMLSTSVALDNVDGSGDVTGEVTSVSLGDTGVVAGPTDLSLSLPSPVGNGGELRSGSISLDNTDGPDIPNAQVDVHVTPQGNTGNLSPQDVILEECVGGSDAACTGGTFDSVEFFSDGDGGLVGTMPDGSGEVPVGDTYTDALLFGTNPSAPVGPVHVTVDLDTSSGDTGSSVAEDTANVTLAAPTITFNGVPDSLPVGADYSDFTATITNNTGSDYNGVRDDITLTAGASDFSASDVTLQYCPTGNNCTAADYQDVPLTGTGTLTGFIGGPNGSAIPDGSSGTTGFRIKAASDAPVGSLVIGLTLDKITSATEIATGDITNNSAVTEVTGTPPTITAALTSAHPKSIFGWYRSAVTVTFTCTAGSAPLTGNCPSPVTVGGNGPHSGSRTITDTSGQSATVHVSFRIDHTKPFVGITGVKKAERTNEIRFLHCRASDKLSGVASCHISKHRHGHVVRYRVTARDKAGNVSTKHGKLHFPQA